MKANRLFIAGVAALSLAACGGGTDYTATLSGGSEKPTAVSSSGTGNVTVTVGDKLEVSGTFSGLTSNASLEAASPAHIHGPVDGTGAGPVFCNLTVPSATSGTIGAGSGSGSCGDHELTDAEKQYFADGKMYVNIHTSNNPGGEVRGDLVKK